MIDGGDRGGGESFEGVSCWPCRWKEPLPRNVGISKNAKEGRHPSEASEGKEMDSPPLGPIRPQPCWYIDFTPVTLTLDSRPPEL